MLSPESAGLAYGLRVENPDMVEIKIPIGCASYLNGFIIFNTSEWRIVWVITFSVKLSSCFLEGSSPWIKRNATYKNVDCSASCSIGYPLYYRMPLSPSIYEILEVEQIVFIYPGS